MRKRKDMKNQIWNDKIIIYFVFIITGLLLGALFILSLFYLNNFIEESINTTMNITLGGKE